MILTIEVDIFYVQETLSLNMESFQSFDHIYAHELVRRLHLSAYVNFFKKRIKVFCPFAPNMWSQHLEELFLILLEIYLQKSWNLPSSNIHPSEWIFCFKLSILYSRRRPLNFWVLYKQLVLHRQWGSSWVVAHIKYSHLPSPLGLNLHSWN